MKIHGFLRRTLACLLLAFLFTGILSTVFSAQVDQADVSPAPSAAAAQNLAAVETLTAEHSDEEIVGFWLNSSNFSSTANLKTVLANLSANKVTDIYFLVKGTDGDALDTTMLETVIANKGNMRVHAWLMCGRDDAYIAENPTQAFYHFREGYKNRNAKTQSAGKGYYNANDGVTGYVNLRSTAYQTYFIKNYIDKLVTISGLDGIHLDSIRYGAMTYDWGSELKTYMGKEDYNTVAKALCVTNNFNYTTDTNGYIIFQSRNTTGTTSGKSLEDLFSEGSTAAQRLLSYRTTTVSNFVSAVQSEIESKGLILTTAVMPEIVLDNYQTAQYGQSCEKLGAITDYIVPMAYTMNYYDYTQTSGGVNNAWPASIAKAMVQQGANVVVGLQGFPTDADNAMTGSAPDGAALLSQVQYIRNQRRSLNGNASVKGDILGTAIFRGGNSGSVYTRVRYNPTAKQLIISIVNTTSTPIAKFNVRLTGSMTYTSGTAITNLSEKPTYNAATKTLAFTSSTIAAYGTRTFTVPLATADSTVDFSKANMAIVWTYDSNGKAIPNYTRESWVKSGSTAHESCTYTKSVGQAATCSSSGYSLYTCSVCGDKYTEYVAANGVHTFNANGVCTVCGYDHGDLIHFKAGSEESTWDWTYVNSTNTSVSYDLSANGSMIGTGASAVNSSGNKAAKYFLVWNGDKYNCSYRHTICANDVIQVRYRWTQSSGTNVTGNTMPYARFHIEEDGASKGFRNAVSSTSISMASTGWQTLTMTIPGSVYSVGDTIDRILFAPFGGNTTMDATVEIDYIYIGQQSTAPITVTFLDDDGTVLEQHPISPSSSTAYYGGEPTKASTATERYIFRGWRNSSGAYVDPTATVFTQNTTLTANYTTIHAAPLGSSKTISDSNPNDETYTLTIDAYTYGKQIELSEKLPLNITIVLDRSGSMSFPADPSKDTSFADYSDSTGLTALNNYLKTLDTTKPQGYYTATNWLNVQYYSSSDYGYGYVSFEPLRYNQTTKTWQVWMTKSVDELTAYAESTESTTDYWYDYCAPFGILGSQISTKGYGGFNPVSGSWVDVTEAYREFSARRTFFKSEIAAKDPSYDLSKALFKISIPRRTVLADALDSYIDQIYATTNELGSGQYHTISVVSYGYGVYADGEKIAVMNDVAYSNKTAPTVSTSCIKLDSAADVSMVKDIISNGYSYGVTRTDLGMKKATTYLTEQNKLNPTGKNVVILVTDGAPTTGTAFENSVANAAIVQATTLASPTGLNAQVFTLGYMDGLDYTKGYNSTWSTSGTDAQKANNFLHLVSSEYPNAVSMTNSGSRNGTDTYYLSTANGQELAVYTEHIYNATSFTETATIDGPILLRDIVTREFVPDSKLSSGYYISYTVQSYDYIGLGEFSSTPKTLDASKYKITETLLSSGDLRIDVSWTDAPNAYLREEKSNNTLGYKLVVTFNITVNRNHTIGGNNIPTNGSGSGAFYPANNPTLETIYPIPNVNVQPKYSLTVHDYFMDLTDAKSNGVVTKAGLITTIENGGSVDPFMAMFTRTVALDGKNNKYVGVKHFVTDANNISRFSEVLGPATVGSDANWKLGRGKDDISASGKTTSFDYTSDMANLTTGYYVSPATKNVDSLGRQPYATVTDSRKTNYYAPKFAVIDFGTKIAIDLDREASLSPTQRNNTCTIENGAVVYESEQILQNLTTAKYQVTAINTPKGQSGKTVNRTAHIFPANVVNYETSFLSERSSGWVDVGTMSSVVQKYDNSLVHGYDPNIRADGAADDYSYGHILKATVSPSSPLETLSFTFTGTGFDVISVTGPNEGAVVVSLYKSDQKTLVKTFLSYNYLESGDLYQIPVVHCTDLEYGTYYVKITALYDKIFDQSLRTREPLTDERIRELLGLTEDDELELFLAQDAVAATRAAETATATESSGYCVHIDGIRIYQTLDATPSDTAARYAYECAKENASTFVNAKDLLLDATSWVTTVNDPGCGDGITYIAATGSSTDIDGTVEGIHLNMSGELKHETVDGRNYLIDAAGNRIKSTLYGTDIYYTVGNDGTYSYFCTDANGKEVKLSADDIRNEQIVFYDAKYETIGPENEVYLRNYDGIAFHVGDSFALSEDARILVSARSLNGKRAYLQVYSESQGKFVNIFVTDLSNTAMGAATNRTEMYYDLTPYITSNGDIYIRSANPKVDPNGSERYDGILSLCNFKLIGDVQLTSPTDTVSRALEAFRTDPETCSHSDITEHTAVAPTCTAEGSIAYWHCTDCDTCFADAACTTTVELSDTVLEKAAHTSVTDEAVAPTCTEDGKTEGAHCAVCNEILLAQEPIEALGHDYHDGICDRCGEDAPKPIAPMPTYSDFTDLPADAWYRDSVTYALENGLMNGVGHGKFDPEGELTRAMLVTILYRANGSPAVDSAEHPFTDVESGLWYTDAVIWASQTGLVKGISATTFCPDDPITREQIATILFRLYQSEGNESGNGADLTVFPDRETVSPWAVDAMRWAVGNGLIKGIGGSLSPQANATRAQVATILMRYLTAQP